MYNLKPSQYVVYALIGCLTNLQLAHAQTDSSTEAPIPSVINESTGSLAKEPKTVRRARPLLEQIPIADELILRAGYLYGDSSSKQSTGLTSSSSVSGFNLKSTYGISKYFFMGLELTAIQAQTTVKSQSSIFNTETKSTTEGLTNPQILAAMQFPKRPLTFVLGATLSLSPEEQKTSIDKNGNFTSNAYSGGNSITPFAIAHNNSQSFLIGAKVGYKVKDTEKSSSEGSKTYQLAQPYAGNQNQTQTLVIDAKSETTGGNELSTGIFMQLPSFYQLGLSATYTQSESSKTIRNGITTTNDGESMASGTLYMNFEINRNISIIPGIAHSQLVNKPNNVDSRSSTSGAIFGSFNF